MGSSFQGGSGRVAVDGTLSKRLSDGIPDFSFSKLRTSKFAELRVRESGVGVGGPSYASPYGDGKVYLSSARGVVTVVRPGAKLDIIARNNLDERVMATPAISQGQLIVRTEKALYAFVAASNPR